MEKLGLRKLESPNELLVEPGRIPAPSIAEEREAWMVEDEEEVCRLERSERQDLCLGSVTPALRGTPSHPSQGKETAPDDPFSWVCQQKIELLKGDFLRGKGDFYTSHYLAR